MSQLRWIQLGATFGVLAATAGGALVLVHWSLRPLRRMESAARAIAAGDLEHPIADERSTTEVGRLGAALNSMMEQIRASFAEQERAQSKLRRFLADASHELRTPITSVRGYAQLHQRTRAGADPETDRIMSRIEGAGLRMGSLVEDLLTLSRDGLTGAAVQEPVEVGEIVRAVADDARAAWPERSVTVRVADDPVVSGDPDRLHRAVANLVENALRHTSGPVEVEATASGADVVVAVIDHGVGIAPEHLPHLFDPFFRADPSRSRDSGGAGLGLAIVSAIAAAHDGRIEVDSRPGEGSRFELRLPRLGG
jgi:two-component system OmpR family sensor kinase